MNGFKPSSAQQDIETLYSSHGHHDNGQILENPGQYVYRSNYVPFAGRVGGNQAFILDRYDSSNASLLRKAPDATFGMTLTEQFDLRPLRNPRLWKAAILEGMGTLMQVYITMWIGMTPQRIPNPPNTQFGNFNNAAFIGPLVGAVTSFVFSTLFTFSFSTITGSHLNPTITIATFCTGLCSLPRMLLYVSFQTGGGALAGLLARASYGTRDFKAGGCWLYSDVVPVGDAFIVEFVACTLLLFFAFGVGLDPRQRQLIGPSLAPFLVGLASATLSFGTAFTRYGYGGATFNPAKCFGVFVGSRFPGWHWVHWTADILACIVHAAFYQLIPPWEKLTN